jgi:hypothetical protein
MPVLTSLDWRMVRDQYDIRERTHHEMLRLHRSGNVSSFIDLLLGISDPSGNYSAAEHGIGPKVLDENIRVEGRLLEVVTQFLSLTNAHEVPPIIRGARLRYFQIGVGSEALCMVNPQFCWVANVRTIWTHLVYKHDFRTADDALELYQEADAASEMAYRQWQALHAELADTIPQILDEGVKLAKHANVIPGPIRYLWVDAIANQLYADHRE